MRIGEVWRHKKYPAWSLKLLRYDKPDDYRCEFHDSIDEKTEFVTMGREDIFRDYRRGNESR